MYFGIWCTPVFFNKDILPENLNIVWYLNPMAAIVEGWRWCLFYEWKYNIYFLPSLIAIIPLFIIALYLYKNSETEFADFA
jgi:ABC-type polysaccharide/polyol phosphate export permease